MWTQDGKKEKKNDNGVGSKGFETSSLPFAASGVSLITNGATWQLFVLMQ